MASESNSRIGDVERTPNIDEIYISLPEIVRDSGRTRGIVYNWFKYHRYMDLEYVLGKPVAKRAAYEQFKIDHPEEIRNKVEETANAA